MTPARKKKKKKVTRKKSASKSATRKKPTRKASKRKTAPKSKTGGKRKKSASKKAEAPKKAPAPARPAKPGKPDRRAPKVKSARPRRSRSRDDKPAPLFGPQPLPGAPQARLGVKYLCFECGAKFYDLNRPEPLCPKCGTDQRKRPKNEPAAKAEPLPPEPPPERRRSPLLDDEEDDSASRSSEGELELGLDAVDVDDDDFLGDEEETPSDEDEA